MSEKSLIGPWIRRFLLEHLVTERNLSHNTQASYRDTLTLLLPFVSTGKHIPIDKMVVEDLTADILRRFLDHLESVRHCGGATRNVRLAAIHSLARFIATRSPVHIAWATDIRSIPFKRAIKASITYLEKVEIDTLLEQPDQRSAIGLRDHTLLLFLYNSGARAAEAAQLRVDDLHLGTSPSVRILGKGNKVRFCPLWPATSSLMSNMVAHRKPSEPVFLGRTHQPITRFGIYNIVTRYAELAEKAAPSLTKKRVSPHTIRHTTAVHLLRSGVDINTIRAWLGHVSLDTTHIYAEVDIEMKAKALATVDISDELQSLKVGKPLPSLMMFLKGL